MINVLCDTALVYGFANDKKVISDQLVRDVIADKQQYSIFPMNGALAGFNCLIMFRFSLLVLHRIPNLFRS